MSTLDPETVHLGFMLLSPQGQLWIVTYVTRISMQFSIVDEDAKEHAPEGWEPIPPSGPCYTYMFCFKSFDGQETSQAHFTNGEQMVGWELIASVPTVQVDEASP